MIVPKIVYNPGSGSITLNPTWPPTKGNPVDNLAATRHDSITSDGHMQSVVERIDSINSLSWTTVPVDDLAAWTSFMQYALTGGQFDYYPDSTSGTHSAYQLIDTDWNYKRVMFQTFAFTMNMRKYVA